MKYETQPSQSTNIGGNGNRAVGTSSSIPERTQETVERLRDTAIEKIEETRDQAREGVDRGRQQMADRIRRLGSALRSTSESLKSEDELVAHYAEMASERMDRAAGYMSSADFGTVLHDVENFARRRPAVFFGGAFLIGLAAGRFLKSSETREPNMARGRTGRSSVGRRYGHEDLEGLFDAESARGDTMRGPSHSHGRTPSGSPSAGSGYAPGATSGYGASTGSPSGAGGAQRSSGHSSGGPIGTPSSSGVTSGTTGGSAGMTSGSSSGLSSAARSGTTASGIGSPEATPAMGSSTTGTSVPVTSTVPVEGTPPRKA